jgi:carbon-monoxide dehydrogenase small subunit
MFDREISMTVNSVRRSATVEPRTTLVDFLRDTLRLTGTHIGCEHGICGACSVMLDGAPVRACLIFAVQADGRAVTTVEGHAAEDGGLNLVQDCFWETHALQCGYCTSGMLIAANALLQRNPDPTETEIREAISGNLCRCTGYVQIVEAIKLAADRMHQRDGPKQSGTGDD